MVFPEDEEWKERRRSIMAHPSFLKYLIPGPLRSNGSDADGHTSSKDGSAVSQISWYRKAGSVAHAGVGELEIAPSPAEHVEISPMGKSIINRRQRPLALKLNRKPILVFWETTKACPLACTHCRATAMKTPQPGELSTAEGFEVIRQVAEFGGPAPILVLTGGDVLMRPDLEDLVGYARDLKVRVALAPAVSDRIDESRMAVLFRLGVRSVSVSLDGISSTHDSIRGIDGHYLATLNAIALFSRIGFRVQVNTAVMSNNVHDLPAIAQLLFHMDVKVWEVFFLVQTGRGASLSELDPRENEDVARFLYDVSAYGISVRTVEAPFYRRVVLNLRDGASSTPDLLPAGELYQNLGSELRERLGSPEGRPATSVAATRDGKGIIFVAHDGTVYPSGFLPYNLGNVRSTTLSEIYHNHPLLKAIRTASFSGHCGECNYRDICGGSRSRAYSYYKNPLASDPGCVFVGA